MGSLSFTHLLLLLAILLIFFGPSRLPQLGSSVGKAIRGFKKGLNTDDDEETRDVTQNQQLNHQNQQNTNAQKQKQDQNQG